VDAGLGPEEQLDVGLADVQGAEFGRRLLDGHGRAVGDETEGVVVSPNRSIFGSGMISAALS